MKYICPPEKCTACMACKVSCRHDAIKLEEDDFGFLRPYIDKKTCVRCGVCTNTCPENRHVKKIFPSKCFAAISKNNEILKHCASGGVAYTLALNFIEAGGIVFACSGKDIKNVHHEMYNSTVNLKEICGSRYVQSRIEKSLLFALKDAVAHGKKVLFIGTGCQTAGVRNLFKNYPENLYLVDIVCHGVCSQKMLNEHIDYYSRKFGRIDYRSIKFRKKTSDGIRYGWAMTLCNDRQSEIFIDWDKDAYLAGFFSHLTLRKSCYFCRYAFNGRCTDITLSDFWGLSNKSALSKYVGVSSVLINTNKGANLFSSLKTLIVEERDVEEAILGVGRLREPSPKPSSDLKIKFEGNYICMGFNEASRISSLEYYHYERLRKNYPLMYRLHRLFHKIGF